jgi:hypothetical protein
MGKLKLESLRVESFQTTSSPQKDRGTVAAAATGTNCYSYDPCEPSRDPNNCAPTDFMDCTYGCTRLYNTCGGNYCWIDKTSNCTS